jgi:hypothetical protein
MLEYLTGVNWCALCLSFPNYPILRTEIRTYAGRASLERVIELPLSQYAISYWHANDKQLYVLSNRGAEFTRYRGGWHMITPNALQQDDWVHKYLTLNCWD